MRGLIVALCLLSQVPVLAETPDDAVLEAVSWVQENGNAAPGMRFFSLYNLPETATRTGKDGQPEEYSPHDEAVRNLLLAVNSLNRVNPACKLIQISETLFGVYMDEPGWEHGAWENLASQNVYFHPDWVQVQHWSYLSYATGSAYPIMRADEFVVKALQPPHYYDFLFGVGKVKTKDELYKALGVDEKFIGGFNLIRGEVVADSGVTHHNRRLEFRPGPFDVWTSHDTESDSGEANVFERLGHLPGKQHELKIVGNEHIFFLSNGLIGGYLNNAKGDRINVVPPNVATDPDFGTRDVSVFAGQNCISCHSDGVRAISCDLSAMLKPGAVELWTTDAQGQKKLASVYDAKKVIQAVEEGQKRHKDAVQDIFGTDGDTVARGYRLMASKYIEGHLTLEDVCRECGMDEAEFMATIKPSISPVLQKLIPQGNPSKEWVSRTGWEGSFRSLMLLKGRPEYQAWVKAEEAKRADLTESRYLNVGSNTLSVPRDQPVEKYDSNAIGSVKVEGGKSEGDSLRYPVTIGDGVEWVEFSLKGGAKQRFEVSK